MGNNIFKLTQVRFYLTERVVIEVYKQILLSLLLIDREEAPMLGKRWDELLLSMMYRNPVTKGRSTRSDGKLVFPFEVSYLVETIMLLNI